MRTRLTSILALAGAAAALAVGAAAAAPASAASSARPFAIGFADSLFGTESGGLWAGRTASAGADAVRINVYWSSVAAAEPAQPRLSDDPAYDWQAIDRAVIAADSHGLDVLMTVLSAPPWAEGPHRPDYDQAPAGTWRPDPGAYGDFAHAIAQRYSGFHATPAGLGVGYLPEVDLFAAWNEPNITAYLSPQFENGRNVSPEIYAGLLDSFYDEVQAVNPDAEVSTGGTAPFGDSGTRRTAPLAFWRGVMCLTPSLERDGACRIDEPPRFDILAHHPISYLSSPAIHAVGTDDMTVADFGELTAALRAAEKLGTVGPDEVHRLIAPEIWWESKPGERKGISARKQARYSELAMYLLWKQGADGVWFLQVRDSPNLRSAGVRSGRLSSYQTGIYTYNERRKPAFDAIRFPFVTDRLSRRSVRAWGRAPRSGKLRIEVKAKHGRRWHRRASVRVSAGDVFSRRLKVRGAAKVRARIGRDSSLTWRQR